MKTIAIISRNAYPNYGSLFQAFSLQKVIEKLGHRAYYINYQNINEQSWHLTLSSLKESKMSKNIFTKIIYCFIQMPNYIIMLKKFAEFQRQYIKSTIIYASSKEISENMPKADIYCTGSDQVWNTIHNEIDYTYFLDFLKYNEYRISYASSFGTDYVPEKEELKIKNLLQKYNHISVREKSGLKILNDFGLEGQQVADPVFLLTRKEWEDIASKSLISENYILIYQLHSSREFDNFVKNFEYKNNYKIIRITTDIKQKKARGCVKYLPDVHDVLCYFRYASYVITDSFHATSFSIIFNKVFFNILPQLNRIRILDLLSMFGLESQIIDKNVGFAPKEINYDTINNQISRYREDSLKYLQNAIEQKL